jgi:hypothetical protein
MHPSPSPYAAPHHSRSGGILCVGVLAVAVIGAVVLVVCSAAVPEDAVIDDPGSSAASARQAAAFESTLAVAFAAASAH